MRQLLNSLLYRQGDVELRLRALEAAVGRAGAGGAAAEEVADLRAELRRVGSGLQEHVKVYQCQTVLRWLGP